jgi:hypothetical protein
VSHTLDTHERISGNRQHLLVLNYQWHTGVVASYISQGLNINTSALCFSFNGVKFHEHYCCKVIYHVTLDLRCIEFLNVGLGKKIRKVHIPQI